MAIKITHSDAKNFSPGGIWEPTRANFPAVQHFWSCPQSDIGTSGLTDLFGVCNLVKNPADTTGLIKTPAAPDGFSVFPSAAAASTTLSGTLAEPPTATTSTLLIAVMQASTSAFTLGDTGSGAAMSLTAAGTSALVGSDSTTVACTAFTNGGSTIYGRALIVNQWNDATTTAGHGMQSLEATATSTITAKTITTTTGVAASDMAGWGASQKWACATSVTNLYGAALIFFSSVPSVTFIESLLAWHTYHWSIGNKWIWPGLKGVT